MGFFSKISNFLSGTIGNNQKNNKDDVKRTKHNLSETGYFDEDSDDGDDRHNPILTRKMDDGIKNFQRDHGLKIDGIMKPGGETETVLHQKTREKKSQNNQQKDETLVRDPFQPAQESGSDFMQVPMPVLVPVRAPKPVRKPMLDNPFGYDHDILALADQPAKTDATGRVIKTEKNTPPQRISLPKKKPVAPEPKRASFDTKTAPVVNLEKDRTQALINNTPAKFEIRTNSHLNDPSMKERAKQIFFKNENFGNEMVRKHKETIEKMAQKHGVDPDLIKSVMWTENARGHGFGMNDLFDNMDISKTQAPMNINGKIWGDLVNKSGQRLYNDKQNIEAGVILLKRIRDRIDNPTPEKIGSIWNFTGREKTNEIGKEIGEAYRTKPWEK